MEFELKLGTWYWLKMANNAIYYPVLADELLDTSLFDSTPNSTSPAMCPGMIE